MTRSVRKKYLLTRRGFQYGDSPTCLDQTASTEDHVGARAVIQGFGETEDGEAGTLLEAEVGVISNAECVEILRSNLSQSALAEQIGTALPHGVDPGLVCTQGDLSKGVFSGACRGDDGGPLQLEDEAGRTTLIGIVSGGVGCGDGVPSWYSRVNFHLDWIKCIVQKSAELQYNQQLVEEVCRSEAQPQPACVNEKELIFGAQNLNQADYKLCEA